MAKIKFSTQPKACLAMLELKAVDLNNGAMDKRTIRKQDIRILS
jgi:hypothetical protein